MTIRNKEHSEGAKGSKFQRMNCGLAEYEYEDKEVILSYAPAGIRPRVPNAETPYSIFKKMRRIKSTRLSFYNDGKDAGLFVMQGEFMAEFRDSYEDFTPCNLQHRSYAAMTDNQLRSYFTWRTKVREGTVEETSLNYVFVYIYELINDIGVTDCLDGIEKLASIWKEYSRFSNSLDRFLNEWIKDYYVCGEFQISFLEIVKKCGLESFYPHIVNPHRALDCSFKTLSRISGYSFEKGTLYSRENAEGIEACFDQVMINLEPLFELYELSMNDVLNGCGISDRFWNPFRDAVYKHRFIPDKRVEIGLFETYEHKSGQWNVKRLSEDHVLASELIGYIIKRIEWKMSADTGYQNNLSINRETLISSTQNVIYRIANLEGLVVDANFDEIIDATVDAYQVQTGKALGGPITFSIPLSSQLAERSGREPYSIFKKMRTLRAKCDGGRAMAELFCRQALILLDLEDDFLGVPSCERQQLTFGDMTNDQLRCYITWRTGARKGVLNEIPLPYLSVYLYELINRIGVEDHGEAIDKMAELLNHYRGVDKKLEDLIAEYIKSYYVYNDMEGTFWEVAERHQIEEYYPHIFIEDRDYLHRIAMYKYLSGYKIENSRFYSGSGKQMIEECFTVVMDSIDQLFERSGLVFRQFIVEGSNRRQAWTPFKNGIYRRRAGLVAKDVKLCESEAYQCADGFWECITSPKYSALGAQLVGYIMKYMEIRLRERTHFKYKLTASKNALLKALKDHNPKLKQMILDPEFNQTIDDAVDGYLKKPISVEVQVDPGKLERIRYEAEVTRERLTIEADPGIEQETSLPSKSEPDALDQDGEGWRSEAVSQDEQQPGTVWEALYRSLSQVQRAALELILSGRGQDAALSGRGQEAELSALAKENRVMVEVLLEGINEAALDYIGDNIIETAERPVYIFEDYADEIEEMLRRN